MPTVTYESPDGSKDGTADIAELRTAIFCWPSDYWRVGSGGATLRYVNGGETSMLLILPHLDQYGIYLKYFGPDNQEWLSLSDRDRLDQVAECADEWYASVGLFLPVDAAWVAIEEFIRSGTKSASITWIQHQELPENGNS